jgi:beta-lactamase superfamily II metal-dependent hydrolase
MLVQLNGGEEGIVIRAWIITHAHGDHYAAFRAFAPLYAADVTLETVMISPVESSEAYLTAATGIAADVAEFDGAELCYVHTGMTFRFCNVRLEVLFTGDELWIAEPTRDEGLSEAQNPNNASIVSRIYTDDYSALFLADASEEVGLRMALYYGDYLKSDMCQVAHHGVEDFPLIAYRFINAALLWYPCDTALYNRADRDREVRDALANSAYTKEIVIRDFNTVTKDFGLYGK